MFKLAVYLKGFKKECILGPIFKFMEAVFELLLPTVMSFIINDGVMHRDSSYVFKMGGLMVLMASLGFGCSAICQYFASRASQGFGTVLRNDLYDRISGFSYAQIDEFGTSTLTNRITNDINQLQAWVAMMIRLVPRAPFIFIGAIIMSMIMDFKLSLVLIAATPILTAIIYFITVHASPFYRSYQKKLDAVGALLRESLSGVRVIRAFVKVPEETHKFNKANDSLTDTGLSIGRISALFNPLTALVINAAIVIILWVGGIHINAGHLSQGQIIAFINYVNQILYALLTISNLIITLTKSMASADRVNEIMTVTPGDGITPNNIKKSDIKTDKDTPAVLFDHVSFAYPNSGGDALTDISVEIHRGETVGIIGATGSGKSTLVNLIPRFYKVERGTVFVDGIPVNNYPRRKLREKIGVVPQKADLFTGTIADNIRWGNPFATYDDIAKAADTAQASEFISLMPQGYDTPIQRGGVNLSGGQRQRITIARALALNPEILILDDASSALDFATDAKLRNALSQHSDNMTVLVVSERVGVVRYAKKILVLDEGKIIGMGSHDELLNSCDIYRQICLSQLTEKEAEL